jgi:hypothetical protein
MMPRRDLGQREARMARGVGEVAGQHGLETAGIGVAVDRRDHRHRQVHQRPVLTLEEFMLAPPRVRRHAVAFLQVSARTERAFPCAGEHDAAHVFRILGQPRPQVEQVDGPSACSTH